MSDDRPKRVLIVADDLTGAFDTAGPFAQQGLTTMVVAQPMACDADAVAHAQIVSINTGSRHLDANEATDMLERCVSRFSKQKFEILFKKIDSTLRGNVATETLALMNICDRRSALVAPAFPAQGRTVLKGVVHVDGVPLAQTRFAEDALSRPPLQPLGELFAQFLGAENVSCWGRNDPLQLTENGVVVADAENAEDMSEMYSKVSRYIEKTLLVGSAGLGGILAQHMTGNRRTEKSVCASLSSSDDPIVFVVGSRTALSREQVDRLTADADTLLLEAPNGVVQSFPDLRTARQIVVVAVTDSLAGDANAADVAQQIARNALSVADRVGAGALVVTGGDTAIAVLSASNCALVDVAGNLLPGIPYARLERNGRSIVLVTKAGGFGTPDTFTDIVRCLRDSSRVRADDC